MTTTKHAVLYRMHTPELNCPFGVRALELLQAEGWDIDEHVLRTREEVAAVLALAEAAGATIVKSAQDVFWGGHAGYFTDPDGHYWEVAWNPHFPIEEDGSITLTA